MSQPYRQGGGGAELPEPLEDTKYSHITSAQLNYIEILSKKLNFTNSTRNAHIESILAHSRHRGFDKRFDIWLLSKVEASIVIFKFKQWIEDRDA